jgi:tRNA-dihydrouridine synthase
MLARGALGNPWLFEQVLGTRATEPTPDEVLTELDWVMDRAVEHLGADRAGRYLRKFYPWYLDRLHAPKELQQAMQATSTVAEARAVMDGVRVLPAAA